MTFAWEFWYLYINRNIFVVVSSEIQDFASIPYRYSWTSPQWAPAIIRCFPCHHGLSISLIKKEVELEEAERGGSIWWAQVCLHSPGLDSVPCLTRREKLEFLYSYVSWWKMCALMNRQTEPPQHCSGNLSLFLLGCLLPFQLTLHNAAVLRHIHHVTCLISSPSLKKVESCSDSRQSWGCVPGLHNDAWTHSVAPEFGSKDLFH